MIEDLDRAFDALEKALEFAEVTHREHDENCGGVSRAAYDRIGESLDALGIDLEDLCGAIEDAKDEVKR